MAFLVVHEVGQTLSPGVLKLYQNFHKFIVVFQLRINNFNVLLILSKKVTEVHERLLYAFSKDSHGLGLVRRNSPENSISG